MKKIFIFSFIVLVQLTVTKSQTCPDDQFDKQFFAFVNDNNLEEKYFEYIGEERRKAWSIYAFDTLNKERYIQETIKKFGGNLTVAIFYDYKISDLKTGTGNSYNNLDYFSNFSVSFTITSILKYKDNMGIKTYRKVSQFETIYKFYFAPWPINKGSVFKNPISEQTEELNPSDDPIKGKKNTKIIIPKYPYSIIF